MFKARHNVSHSLMTDYSCYIEDLRFLARDFENKSVTLLKFQPDVPNVVKMMNLLDRYMRVSTGETKLIKNLLTNCSKVPLRCLAADSPGGSPLKGEEDYRISVNCIQ